MICSARFNEGWIGYHPSTYYILYVDSQVLTLIQIYFFHGFLTYYGTYLHENLYT